MLAERLAFLTLLWRGSALHHRGLSLEPLNPLEPLEVPLTRAPEGWYVAEVELGGTKRHLVVDTGSPWLWSFKSESEGEEEHEEEDDAPHFRVQYTGVALEGVVLQQTLGLSGQAAHDGTAQQCTVGRATSGDEFWLRQKGVDGVAGLACGTADVGSSSTPDGLNVSTSCFGAATGSRQFSVELTEDGGTLSFGAIPERLLVGLHGMPPAILCGNWRAPMQALAGEGDSAKPVGEPAEAILDSGEPGIRGPLQAIMELAAALGADTRIDPESGSAVHFEVPCSKALKPLTVALGTAREVRATVQGAELVRKDSKGACSVMLRGSDAKQWVLGMPFFRSIRGVVFNADAQQVSIAP